MRFAVTGGLGFIGRQIVRRLGAEGHTAVIIDSAAGQGLPGAEVLRLDILDYGKLRAALEGVSGVFHQAALTSVQESWPREDLYRRVNVAGTANVLRAAHDLSLRVVHASSAAVYGDAGGHPVTEDAPRNPANPYGATKLEAERLAEEHAARGGSVACLRYFNVYGPGQNPSYAGVVSRFAEAVRDGRPPVIFGDGGQSRDFVFVDDVARANLAAMSSRESGFFNIGTGRPTTVREIAEAVIRISGARLEPERAPLPPGDVRSSRADISRARELLSWEPRITLEAGLADTLHAIYSPS